MKDEIEEILNYLTKFINDKEEITKYGCEISVKQAKHLLDYIANLQEEIKSLKGSCKALGKKRENQRKELIVLSHNLSKKNVKVQTLKTNMKELQQENERLKEENKRIFSKVNDDELLISNAMNYAEAQNYKSRCEKASEYIKENPARCWYDAKKKSEKFGDIEIINHQKILLDILQGSDK